MYLGFLFEDKKDEGPWGPLGDIMVDIKEDKSGELLAVLTRIAAALEALAPEKPRDTGVM